MTLVLCPAKNGSTRTFSKSAAVIGILVIYNFAAPHLLKKLKIFSVRFDEGERKVTALLLSNILQSMQEHEHIAHALVSLKNPCRKFPEEN